MRPGGTPESPMISIQGKDVYLLKFGMKGEATLFTSGRDFLLDALHDHEVKEGSSADYWTETVDIDASPSNLAFCGLAYKYASTSLIPWRESRHPDPASATGAGLAAEKVIIQEGMDVLAALAGGDERLQEYMSAYVDDSGSDRQARIAEVAFGPASDQ